MLVTLSDTFVFLHYWNELYLQSWTKVLRILQFLTHRMPIRQIWYPYNLSPCPTLANVVQSRTKMTQPDFSIFVLERNGDY